MNFCLLIKAQKRLSQIEQCTNCQIETASELLTLLSFGAHPQERVLFCNKKQSNKHIFYEFMVGVFKETKAFIVDVELSLLDILKFNTKAQVITFNTFSLCKFKINILDYCKRAVYHCEEVLRELGLWCSVQIARVFVKHLIGLYYEHSETKNCTNELNSVSENLVVNFADQMETLLLNLISFCITQFSLLVRLFQLEFDS